MARETLSLKNADIGFRNFEGRPGPYNKKGERSFVVFLDDQLAMELKNEGWNIKFPKEREDNGEEDNRRAYLQISVGFEYYPAQVYLVSNAGTENVSTIKLGQEEVEMLDWAEIDNVDLVIRPYNWEVNDGKGIKAYLKAGYFKLYTDEFAQQYGL